MGHDMTEQTKIVLSVVGALFVVGLVALVLGTFYQLEAVITIAGMAIGSLASLLTSITRDKKGESG